MQAAVRLQAGRISEATVWKTSRGELRPKSLRSMCPVTSRKRHLGGTKREGHRVQLSKKEVGLSGKAIGLSQALFHP
jgi:hypothetical protein